MKENLYKKINEFKKNEKNFKNRLKHFLKESFAVLGDDYLTNFYLENNFNLLSLTDEHIAKWKDQQIHMPFSNATIDKLIQTKKIGFNHIYNFNKNGKNILGLYLIGKDENTGKKILYSLIVIKNLQNKDNLDFSIKLDFCVKGKKWFPLIRLDTLGNPHLNYLKDGKVATSLKEIGVAITPHLHKNSFETQVIFDKLDYTLAEHVKSLNFENFNSNDKNIFKESMLYFLNYANIELPLNKKIENTFNYDFVNPLWDYEKLQQIKRPEQLQIN